MRIIYEDTRFIASSISLGSYQPDETAADETAELFVQKIIQTYGRVSINEWQISKKLFSG